MQAGRPDYALKLTGAHVGARAWGKVVLARACCLARCGTDSGAGGTMRSRGQSQTQSRRGRRTWVGLFTFAVLTAAICTKAPVTAQDVVKVSPETHAVLLDNHQVRVLDVRIKPGERVDVHEHPDNVIYYLSDGKLRLILPDGRTEDREVKAGTAVWSEASKHAAQNIGTSDFREIQIELKAQR